MAGAFRVVLLRDGWIDFEAFGLTEKEIALAMGRKVTTMHGYVTALYVSSLNGITG